MIKKNFRIKVHPGELLQNILDESGLTQTRLAKHLKMPQSKISEICCGRRGISPQMAMKLGKAFGQSPEFWLNLQRNWELASLDDAEFAEIRKIKLRA